MEKDDCFYLGKITKLHGYKGAMVLFLDTDQPEAYEALDSVFLDIKDKLVPFFIERADPRGNQLIVEFEGVSDEAAAKALVNKPAYLPVDLLPPLSGKQFYFHEVIGFTIVDLQHGEIGPIKSITDHPTNPLFICDHQGKEVLVPMNDDCIVEVDRNARLIRVQTPEGLLDLYLGGANEKSED